MYYQIRNKTAFEASLATYDGQTPMLGYLDESEFLKQGDALGFDQNSINAYKDATKRFHTGIVVYENFSLVTLRIRTLERIEKEDRLCLLIRKNLFLVINVADADGSTVQALKITVARFERSASIEKMIFGTLDALLSQDSTPLEEYEKRIMVMEKQITDSKKSENLNRTVYSMRNRLSVMRIYYEQLTDIAETLEENENDIFSQQDLRYFKILENRAQRLSNNVQILNENLIHLREALDAGLNNSMNKTMKIFTVISVIFQPLSLIAGWYGMNFYNMPELTWKFGYAGVTLLSVSVLVACLIFFKKKNWL